MNLRSAALPPPAPHLAIAWVGAQASPLTLSDWPAVQWHCYADSDDFLLSASPYEHQLYVLALAQQGVGGLDLIRLLHRRSSAPVLALVGAGDELLQALHAGAQMALEPPHSPARIAACLAALRRALPSGSTPGAAESGTSVAQAAQAAASSAWRLCPAERALYTPQGQAIHLSPADLALLACFAKAPDGRVSRDQLCEQVWGEVDAHQHNALQATMYRLRKRVEQASQTLLPIRSVARVGYEFRVALTLDEAAPLETPPA